MITLKKRRISTLPGPNLIDARMILFLGRQLRDILDHLPAQQNTKLARRTHRALIKLKSDRFGLCERCGRPIDLGRILTDPAVENCTCCEQKIN